MLLFMVHILQKNPLLKTVGVVIWTNDAPRTMKVQSSNACIFLIHYFTKKQYYILHTAKQKSNKINKV